MIVGRFAIMGVKDLNGHEGQFPVKPVNLNQLLFHPKTPCLSFYLTPFRDDQQETFLTSFYDDMIAQLDLQERPSLMKLLQKHRASVRKVIKAHSEKGHGFFLSEELQGYIVLDELGESFCMMSSSFHVRPLMEQLLVNPEFMIVNISLYDISVYKADFHHVDIIQHYEFEELVTKTEFRVFSPQYLGLIPHKSILALKTVAQKVMETTQYHSYPVIVTGLDEMRKMFLKHFQHTASVISHFEEDFFEKSCIEIQSRCRVFRPAVMDFYSAQLKERLKRMLKSKNLVTDLGAVAQAAVQGKVIHLILPVEKKDLGQDQPRDR